MSDTEKKPVIGISVGDINGIGPEIILKTFTDPRLYKYCTPIVFTCRSLVNYYLKMFDIKSIAYNVIKRPEQANPKKLNLLCDWGQEENVMIETGQSTQVSGNYAFKSLNSGVNCLREGKIDALVTAPINKANIQSKDFTFPGHSEYLQTAAGADRHLMIMVSDEIKIAVQTGHIPINNVADKLSVDSIYESLSLFSKSLLEDFMIRQPKIAVLGLNPHAGDDGLLGQEDDDIIKPAIEKAKENGVMALGPFPADGFFGSYMQKDFDGILAMYHDQGLIPFKILAFENGVNFTAGLPFIRTSPAHGTGYSIAGKGIADISSFRSAIYTAIKVLSNRQTNADISKDPLKTKLVREKEE